jgi:hypothetical protein
MTTHRLATAALAFTGAALTTIIVTAHAPEPQARPAAATHRTPVELGAYLVKTMGCNDCHTPFKMGPKGPEPDMARALSGHPEGLKMPPPPALPPGPWLMLSAATNTAFAGPWGVSFAMNLTPDRETGLGDWTEEQFVQAMRTGKHQGKGRAILPPMPYQILGQLVPEELKAIFAYLQSLAPLKNHVPQPVDPPESQR